MFERVSHHVRRRVATAIRPLQARWYRGTGLQCPLCGGSFRKLLPYRGSYFVLGQLRDHFTPNCLCPGCGSDIRHRLVATFLDGVLDAAGTGTLLHFAPEAHLARFLQRRSGMTYVACDLDTRHYPHARRTDITNIDLPDHSVDAIVNVHVLEHIDDDRKALRELHRVLRPGG
jgi:SAM-dependent methyltransferase